MTHLLASHQEQTSLFAIQDLSRDDVHQQQFTPAAVQQLHLVTHLGAERVKTTQVKGLSSSQDKTMLFLLCSHQSTPNCITE